MEKIKEFQVAYAAAASQTAAQQKGVKRKAAANNADRNPNKMPYSQTPQFAFSQVIDQFPNYILANFTKWNYL